MELCYNGPFAAMISNFEDVDGNRLPDIKDDFRLTTFRRSDQRLSKLALIINGTEQAIRVVESAIAPIRKRYLSRTSKELSDVLVQVIRKSAEHQKFGHLIGKNCLSTVVVSDGTSESWDYRTPKSSEHNIPHIISGAFSYKDINISTGPGIPSWLLKKK